MSLHTALGCVAGLLALGPAAIAFSRSHYINSVVYGASLAISTAIAATALLALLTLGDAKETQVLPLGLPWLGAHFRLDNLSAFFLLVINFGGASASLFALGYGRHEDAPQRVLPFYPVFIAAMNLVVLSDDAFTFLVSWEFMSLTSWALVLAHHEQPENVQAGLVYLVMASFGTLCLLLAFALLAGSEGGYDFATIELHRRSAELNGLVVVLALIGAGSKAGACPIACMAAARAPSGPEPRLRAHERCDDQGGDLRLRTNRI